MLSQEGSEGGCPAGRGGPRGLAVRRKQRGMDLGPGGNQTKLDRFFGDELSSDCLNRSGQRCEKEWRRTIGTMLRHDLMNKLTVAKGGLELYDRSGEAKFLDMTRRNLETCGEIVGRITSLENSPDSSNLAPTDVANIAKRVMLGHQERGIGLEVHGQGWVMADSTLFSILDNLVSNSIKHAAPSTVRIDIEERGSTVLVKVTDDGIGIPKEARGGLFQEGFKFGPKGNTGLGLFIVRRLVERYGGRIWLDENVSERTVFCIEMANMNGQDS